MHPILFALPFGQAVFACAAMLCLSVIIGRIIAVHLAERNGMNAMLMNRCTIWILAGAIIGARLLFVIPNLKQIDTPFQVFEIWKGGVAAWAVHFPAGSFAYRQQALHGFLSATIGIVPTDRHGAGLRRLTREYGAHSAVSTSGAVKPSSRRLTNSTDVGSVICSVPRRQGGCVHA